MPKTTRVNTSKTSVSTDNAVLVEKLEDDTSEKDFIGEIEELKKQNTFLTDKIQELMTQFKELKNHTKNEEKDFETRKEPNGEKLIRIMSLCYGPLILDEGNGRDGTHHAIKFESYGTIKSIAFSNLVNIFNRNQKLAEKGRFYIMDKDAVYYLGLDSYYENLIPKDVIDNILTYSDVDIKGIINTINKEQKQLVVRTICDKIYYNGSDSVDMNKVELIGKLCNCSIMDMVDEMKKYDYVESETA